MTWKEVESFATTNGLAIYKPMCGHHRLVQITDTEGKPISWTSNKARSAMQALQAIVKQSELERLADDQAIAQGQEAKAFF